MKYPPMPNNNFEQELRELLRTKKFSTVDDDGDFMRLEHSLGSERFSAILKEEGIDFDKYFKMVGEFLKGVGELSSTIGEEKNKFDELLKPANMQAVGELLMAHLKLEYLVDQIVNDNFKVNNGGNIMGNARLSFVQKLGMMPVEPGLSQDVVDALREINRLRNAYVHNIKFDIKNFKSKVFDEALKNETILSEADKFKSIMKLIKGVEIILLLHTPSLKNKIDDIMKDNPVLKEIAFGLGNGKSKTIHDMLMGW